MARTKATARKPTGGRAPRVKLATRATRQDTKPLSPQDRERAKALKRKTQRVARSKAMDKHAVKYCEHLEKTLVKGLSQGVDLLKQHVGYSSFYEAFIHFQEMMDVDTEWYNHLRSSMRNGPRSIQHETSLATLERGEPNLLLLGCDDDDDEEEVEGSATE